MKRFSCICIAIVMLFVGTAAGFAENKQSEVGNVSKIEKGGYDLKGKEFSVSLPAHGNEFVELKSDLLGSIQLSLPDAVHQASPVALPGGVVKYDTPNVAVTERILKGKKKKKGFEFLQSTTIIKNDNASKVHRYKYKLPKGYKLVDFKKYERTKGKKGFAGAYIIDKHKVVVSSIVFTKPKDAQGKEVPTSYKIEKDTIVQKVGFTGKTAFPVKMHRKNHPPRWVYVGKINKKEAIKIRRAIERERYARVLVLNIGKAMIRIISYGSMLHIRAKYDRLCAKYSYAISRVTRKRRHIKVYDIEYWRYGGKNSGYVTRDQELENVR